MGAGALAGSPRDTTAAGHRHLAGAEQRGAGCGTCLADAGQLFAYKHVHDAQGTKPGAN